MPVLRSRRPVRVTLLVILALLAAAWSAIRVIAALSFADTLLAYHSHPPYLVVTGFAGLASAGAAAWGLWRGRRWGWWGALMVSVGLPAWYWADRLLLQGGRANWPFILIESLLLLGLILIDLFSPKTRQYFKIIP